MMNKFTPVLGDFGLTMKMKEKIYNKVGIIRYMAPEIVNYDEKFDDGNKDDLIPLPTSVYADVYSFGKIIEEILLKKIMVRSLLEGE